MNTFNGNGAATSKASPTPPNSNNFGLGLLGVSQNNLVENNRMGGNVNGLYLGGGGNVTGNIFRGNFIAGNPAAQVLSTYGSAIGADIQDFSPAGSNTFDGNYCLTYAGTGPSQCPKISEPDGKDLQGALKPADLGSFFDSVWALLWPRTTLKNGPRPSRPIAAAALNRTSAQQ